MRALTPGRARSMAEAHAARSSAASRRARQEQAAVRSGWFVERVESLSEEVDKGRGPSFFFFFRKVYKRCEGFSPIHAQEASARASPTLCAISMSISGGRSSSVVTGGALRARGVGGEQDADDDLAFPAASSSAAKVTIVALLSSLSEGVASLLLFPVEGSSDIVSECDRGARREAI